MILGNTNGKNRGMKYFKKRNKPQDQCFPQKAGHFSEWFCRNIEPLKCQLYRKYSHYTNDDVFNDTYLRIYERIYFTGFKIDDYKSYFCRAFYTNHVQEIAKCGRSVKIETIGDPQEDQGNIEDELEEKYRNLEKDIFDFVYHNFDIREFELFKMYMVLKIQGKRMTYSVLAGIICSDEYKVHDIQLIISRIKKEVSKEFSHRWLGNKCSL